MVSVQDLFHYHTNQQATSEAKQVKKDHNSLQNSSTFDPTEKLINFPPPKLLTS